MVSGPLWPVRGSRSRWTFVVGLLALTPSPYGDGAPRPSDTDALASQRQANGTFNGLFGLGNYTNKWSSTEGNASKSQQDQPQPQLATLLMAHYNAGYKAGWDESRIQLTKIQQTQDTTTPELKKTRSSDAFTLGGYGGYIVVFVILFIWFRPHRRV